MPTNHEAVAALPAAGLANHELVRDLLFRRMAYVLGDADNPQDLVAVDPATGAAIVVIVYLGRVFLYDATDTTTAHDGVSCLVTSEGRRYKLSENADVLIYSVLDKDTTAQPGSPTLGDAYLLPAASTGDDWAGHDDEIAVYTARGWEFIIPAIGRFIYVEDEIAFYHKDANGDIIAGLGTQTLPAGSVMPSMLSGGGEHIRWPIENQTTNTPPGSPAESVQYIIGPSPTGDWAGHAGKIAHYENGAWVIYAPAAGWLAYDKSDGKDYRYSGSAWVTQEAEFSITTNVYTSTDTWTKPARLSFVIVTVIGGGGGTTTNGSASAFGSHCIGNPGGHPGVGSVGGSATGGDENYSGIAAVALIGGHAGIVLGNYGQGAHDTGTGAGGGGGAARKRIAAAALGSSEAVTVGAGGSGSPAGGAGIVIVENWIKA